MSVAAEVPAWMAAVSALERVDCPVEDYLNMEIAMRSGLGSPPPEYPYASFGDFVLNHGERFPSAPLTPEEHLVVADAVEAARRQCAFLRQPFLALKGCFLNAALLAHTSELRYTEGYAFCGSLVVMHAWVTVNGKVVDLTWGPKRNGHVPSHLDIGSPEALAWDGDGGWEARVLGTIPEGWAYYGVDLTDELYESPNFGGSLIDNYADGMPLLRRPRKD